MKEKCEPCPVNDSCPCNHDYVRCNWKFTFKEVGLWNLKELQKIMDIPINELTEAQAEILSTYLCQLAINEENRIWRHEVEESG